MEVDVLTDIEIERPRSEVADYVSDPDNATAWYENIKKVEWKSPKALKVGAKVAFEARFLGRKMAYTYEINDYVPGQSLVMRMAAGPFPMETSYTFSETPSGATIVELRNRGPPVGIRDHRLPRNGRCNEASEPQRPCSTQVDSRTGPLMTPRDLQLVGARPGGALEPRAAPR
jgi:uncharacterized protein YndB with AHSA1/START domain